LRRRVPLTYWATFHAQQCVEKCFKALLVARGQPFPRTHDVVALRDLCWQHGIIVSMDMEALERLAAHAVQVRYPGEDPGGPEAQEALHVARAVHRFARRLLELR
jgi:HEPN domain-containing protein